MKILILFILCISNTAMASKLVDAALENANKFNAKGMPDFISLDVNEYFLRFKKPQISSYESIHLTVNNTYVFYRDKEKIIEDVIEVSVDWGDTNTSTSYVSGSPITLIHKYSSEGIYSITLNVRTPTHEYYEYARAVVNTDPTVIETSGRVQPQKVLWREDCTGTLIDGDCYEIITNYRYEPTRTLNLISDSGNFYRSQETLRVTGYSGGTYSRQDTSCGILNHGISNEQIYVEYSGYQGCVTRVTIRGVCLYPYYQHEDDNCRETYTTKTLLEDQNIPASMYKPNNVEFE